MCHGTKWYNNWYMEVSFIWIFHKYIGIIFTKSDLIHIKMYECILLFHIKWFFITLNIKVRICFLGRTFDLQICIGNKSPCSWWGHRMSEWGPSSGWLILLDRVNISKHGSPYKNSSSSWWITALVAAGSILEHGALVTALK